MIPHMWLFNLLPKVFVYLRVNPYWMGQPFLTWVTPYFLMFTSQMLSFHHARRWNLWKSSLWISLSVMKKHHFQNLWKIALFNVRWSWVNDLSGKSENWRKITIEKFDTNHIWGYNSALCMEEIELTRYSIELLDWLSDHFR